MRKNPNTDNGGARIGTTSEEDLTAAQLLELFQTAYPINWAQLLPDRLHTLGVTDLASLSPSKLTDFKDAVFRSARHAGIRDPAVWISHRAGRIETKAPLLNPPCGPGEHHASRKIPLASNAIVPRNSPASAAPSTPLSVQRTTSYGTTKAEVLCRTKAAIEMGENLGSIAGRLGCAQEVFRASQREIGRGIGRSASWVNRLLKWRQSGCKQGSPFGPTTRAGRAVNRKSGNNGDDDVLISARHYAPAYQTASLMPPETQRASAQIEVPLDSTLAMREADGVKGEAAQPGSGGRSLEKQQLSVRNSRLGKKLSPERMRSAVEALTEAPILRRAAERAGIHRRTLEYWRRCSEAGQDGYEIEWEGLRWSFHEACEAAVWVAHHTLLDALLDWAFGSIYKIDQDFVDLGMEGDVACARDELGDYLVDVRQPENKKMLRCLLGLLRSATPGIPRTERFPNHGVVIVGNHEHLAKNNCTASVKARRWKSASRMVSAKDEA